MDALVIGAGPAGLMAAEELARAGRSVVVCEAKPSPARKFLMAGKSGLNITKDEDRSSFIAEYRNDWLRPMLAEFGPREMIIWARSLGEEVFTGSTGRVFPRSMKGSPVLRAWLKRLEGAGVELRSRWRWAGFDGDGLAFETPQGREVLRPKVTVLALGGASWARLGSDGHWVPWLAEKGVEIAPWQPANMGFAVAWTPHMAKHFGTAIKGAALLVGDQRERGEFVISARGIEGGGVYAVSRALREGAALKLDLMADVAGAEVAAKLDRMKPGETLANRLRKLGLSAAAVALVMEFGRGLETVAAVKALPMKLAGPRPLDEAISVAGGVTQAAVTDGLELKALPGMFVCGEMLDWEAPTGGYLLTGVAATGRWAGRAAALTSP
ncbi:NAD(FAD)-utilizing dehydrogenase [Cypionkella aquatica]|uniref:NAD(FAD)-utilizing dehydrogenase n=1 Tax=Cypionkella aquatica TaxID=1756042 RepID=A0AA37X0X7_9RHOB|nr:TIGR03862 family flavoprotein [Cypionkella aquatica]GLS88713.1 NAD(FAD)-utilizing dehydrogenase [Cypionkella aquatica]